MFVRCLFLYERIQGVKSKNNANLAFSVFVTVGSFDKSPWFIINGESPELSQSGAIFWQLSAVSVFESSAKILSVLTNLRFFESSSAAFRVFSSISNPSFAEKRNARKILKASS